MTPQLRTWSAAKKNSADSITIIKTMTVVMMVSFRVGHVTFDVSFRTSCTNSSGLVLAIWIPFQRLLFSFRSLRQLIGDLKANLTVFKFLSTDL